MKREGIVIGADRNQEWLLSWWWEHYSAYNSYPVAFADFGMSASKAAWCQEKGIYFQAPPALKMKPVPTERKRLWEEHFGTGISSFREVILRKPFAFLKSPFLFSIWIDLDCRVKGDLKPLFDLLRQGAAIGMRREGMGVQETHRNKGFLGKGETAYNSGVIPYRRDAKILSTWTHLIRKEGEEFASDQHAFAKALRINPTRVVELPEIYNWSPMNGPNREALIYHFHGGFLKDPALLHFFP